jgi:DNA-binding transcriptional regulator YhcF (GntR family)
MEFIQNQAIYLQIADFICERILQHEWQVGEKIPSIREMAVRIEVNPNTVAKTYNYLELTGVIFKERGIGYFIAKHAQDNILKIKRELFYQQDLPLFLKKMALLKINFKELESVVNQAKKSEDL